MRSEEILSLRWAEHAGNPIIRPPFPSPIIADPSFLPPESTPDGRWHLFAHSLVGIHHYVSTDGVAWKRLGGIVSFRSLRPFVHKEAQRFYLLYEAILGLFPMHTRIEMRESADLLSWSKPSVLLEPSLPWHRHGAPRGTIGNPCLVPVDGSYRLYFSAGLVYLDDCKFCEPRYIGIATSKNLGSGYEFHSEPLICPSADDPWMNLGAGSLKVLKATDGFVAFQNGIYWERRRDHSGSAVRILTSKDGYDWSFPSDEPILRPEAGWKKSHVYALDVRPLGDRLHLYFNARSGWLTGRECIGLALGTRAGDTGS